MNIDDIKKGLECCSSPRLSSCNNCPYKNNGEFSCRDGEMYKDALNLITEQEKEIEQFKTSNQNAIDKINELQKEINALQEENRRLDEYVSCTLSAQEFDEEIKQAKIDVLNELKRQAEHCNQWNCEVVPTRYIDEMIEDVKE